MEDWLAAIGFDAKKMLHAPPLTNHQSRLPVLSNYYPVISGMGCVVDVIAGEFQHISTVPKTEVKSNVLRSINSRITTIQSVLGDGILLSHNGGKALVSAVSDSSTILKDVVVAVFNDTSMLDLHFSSSGQDHFYFVQEDGSLSQRNWDQLQRLGTMFNVTMHNIDPSEGGPGGQVEIKIQSPSMLLNIRYGTQTSEEYQRIVRSARRKAIEEAWQHERDLLKSGHRGLYDWSTGEKEEIMSSGSIPKYHGAYIYNVEDFPELADDPLNIILKKESSRKRRNRPRKPK